ncbi:ROK family protein [Kallotenue papyrolyticum]|uniref:ROK family protein n=1 Tax=Kallotenue papyrolyticum TaxID=1325125 RepID=UPI000471977B|nr:ROK family protein [Kallotenue papyrolyticum]
MSTTSAVFGAIEAGGTKFVCAIGSGPDDVRATTRFPTTTPAETLARTIAFFREYQQQEGRLAAIGIGSFGPIDPDPRSPTYGRITATPKPGWANTDIVGAIRAALGVPVAFDTDVNAAVLGEARWGAAQGLTNAVYITVGTGIGGGALVNGQLVHGLVHPEMGHMRLPRDAARDPFAGVCPYHGDCWEGLASGPALAARWGQPAETLPSEHPAWALEAHYLALALVNIICVLSPQRIILGGGVMQQQQLFPLIHHETRALLNGYIRSPALSEAIETFIVPPGLGGRSGQLGALALAQQAAQQRVP